MQIVSLNYSFNQAESTFLVNELSKLLALFVVVVLAQGPEGDQESDDGNGPNGDNGPGGKGPGGKGPPGKGPGGKGKGGKGPGGKGRGPPGGPRGPGGPIVHELTRAVICGQTEMLTCFQPMSNFADIQAAIGKVDVSDEYKKTACQTEEQRKMIHETNKKIHESIKPVMKNQKKDDEGMKTVGECMRKLRKERKDASKVTPAE